MDHFDSFVHNFDIYYDYIKRVVDLRNRLDGVRDTWIFWLFLNFWSVFLCLVFWINNKILLVFGFDVQNVVFDITVPWVVNVQVIVLNLILMIVRCINFYFTFLIN